MKGWHVFECKITFSYTMPGMIFLHFNVYISLKWLGSETCYLINFLMFRNIKVYQFFRPVPYNQQLNKYFEHISYLVSTLDPGNPKI